MHGLGYERYGVQGGDWGGVIAARLARQHSESVLGLHLNFPAGLVPAPAGSISHEETSGFSAWMRSARAKARTPAAAHEAAYARIRFT